MSNSHLHKVISSREVTAITLGCGHTIHRTLRSNAVIPLRMKCDVCEQEAFRRFDTEQAVARARRELLEQLPEEVRKLLDVLPNESSNAALDAAEED